MPSNLYLFDPNEISRKSGNKPLVQIVREAEVARAEASARLLRNAVKRVAALFTPKRPADIAAPANNNAAPAEKSCLAA